MYRDVTDIFYWVALPDHGKRCLAVSTGVDMLGAWRDLGSPATGRGYYGYGVFSFTGMP